jgi:hypothetical protein
VRISVQYEGVKLLAADMRRIPAKAKRDMASTVRKSAVRGNRIAADFARESAGDHGKLYHLAFSAEARDPLSWEYGPDSAMPQGGMSFEYGSRNQPPHLDLNRSADIIGPLFAHDVGQIPDRLFW